MAPASVNQFPDGENVICCYNVHVLNLRPLTVVEVFDIPDYFNAMWFARSDSVLIEPRQEGKCSCYSFTKIMNYHRANGQGNSEPLDRIQPLFDPAGTMSD